MSLFEITKSYDKVYKWFSIAHDKGFRTCAFVIMPNHLHFIMATPYRKANLNTLIGNGKRFLAYNIVEQLKKTGQANLLQQLADEVIPSDRKKGKLHQVFKPSFDGKLILNEKMLVQKIIYIHQNPLKGKWNLVSDYVLYEHSSANECE